MNGTWHKIGFDLNHKPLQRVSGEKHRKSGFATVLIAKISFQTHVCPILHCNKLPISFMATAVASIVTYVCNKGENRKSVIDDDNPRESVSNVV
jgi:hypothetical protein